MKTRRWFRVPLLALSLLWAGCATAAPNPFTGPGGKGGGGQIRIVVQNRSIYQVEIYALVAGDTQDLGQVPARTATQLRMDWPSSANLRFRLEPLAGLRKTTMPMIVRPGDVVDLFITPNPTDSYACAR